MSASNLFQSPLEYEMRSVQERVCVEAKVA
jgi:hypothetical protein